MSTQELQSYRLSSLEDPTDEMLHAIMEQVAESARQSGTKVREEIYRRLEQIKSKTKTSVLSVAQTAALYE